MAARGANFRAPRGFYGYMVGVAEEPARQHLGRERRLLKPRGREAFISIGDVSVFVSHMFFSFSIPMF